MAGENEPGAEVAAPVAEDHAPENAAECRSESSH
jgi:hypothetical protein